MTGTSTTAAITAEELYGRAEALVPVLLERARLCEDLRRIPDETWADLEAAELFAAFSPPSVGGMGFGVHEAAQVIRILAKGCASTAWVYGFVLGHNVAITQDAPHLLAGRPFVAAAASAGIQGNPSVSATPVEGGWRVTGTWKFCSAIMNSEYILIVTLQDNGEGNDPTPIGLIPAVDAGRIEDVWHFSGMKGTGSNTFHLEDAFIPTDQQWGLFGFPELHPRVPDSRMTVSIVRFFDVVLSAVAVGAAEAALEAFGERVKTRLIGYGQGFQREHREAWSRYADAFMQAKATRLMWDALVAYVADLADTGRTGAIEEAAFARMSGPRICQLARDTIQTIAEGSGSSVYHLDNPLQRQQRDVDTLKAHSTLHWDAASTSSGAALLGLVDPIDPLVLG